MVKLRDRRLGRQLAAGAVAASQDGQDAIRTPRATPGGWLDQFMAGAAARDYRVNFITRHWYGGP